MIDIKKRIEVIESLVAKDDVQSLTYAALECRLTIECLCYERLFISHSYLSPADRKGWRPQDVVKQVSKEANELIDREYTLFIGTTPIESGSEPTTKEDYESFEYVEIGKQVGFKISKLHSLWQAVANVALHVDDSYGQSVASPYGNLEKIKEKVADVLVELRKFESNSLIGSSFGSETHIRCEKCACLIKRKNDLLQHGQAVSCFNPECIESYMVNKTESELTFTRRTGLVKCKKCQHAIEFPMRKAESLRYQDKLEIHCEKCGTDTGVTLHIVQEIIAGNKFLNSVSSRRITPSVTWSGQLLKPKLQA